MALGHHLESLEVVGLLQTLLPEVAYEIPHAVDVVSQANTANHLNEDQAECLLIICCCEVAKPHCQHNSCSPVITPDVTFVPWGELQAMCG